MRELVCDGQGSNERDGHDRDRSSAGTTGVRNGHSSIFGSLIPDPGRCVPKTDGCRRASHRLCLARNFLCFPTMGPLLDELRQALRSLRRTPGVSLAAVATLAVGIGGL